jgi:DNA-directed RNA polymerase specialized sigma24 family protein
MNLSRFIKKAPRGSPTYLHSRQDFNDFYDQYAPMLYGQLLRQTENASSADSILAAIFVTFWQERDAFNKSQSTSIKHAPFRWLLRIAHREENQHRISAH